MPIRSSVVGASTGPVRIECDRRWLMAYAAGLGCAGQEYFDTTSDHGLVVHPLFPVAPEWEVLTGGSVAFDYGLEPAELARGVHACHDLMLHRALPSGFAADIAVSVAGVERTRSGARLTLRFDATDAATSAAAWTTWLTSVYRDVDVVGPDRPPENAPSPIAELESSTQVRDCRTIDVGAFAAHVYTECARIWNPIHTDAEIARSAGLDGIILHGTATLAHGITEAARMVQWPVATVRRVGGSFRAMVPVPSTLTVELLDVVNGRVLFQVRTAAGHLAVRNGFLDQAAPVSERAAHLA